MQFEGPVECTVNIWVANTRAMVRDALARAAETDPACLHIERTETGKPFLPDHPELHFNLSHSGQLFVCAITRIGPIGIDVERVRDVPEADDIRRQYALAEGPFLLEWTKREAYLKALGVGLGAIDQPVAPGWYFESFVPEPGYIGAWAIEGKPVKAAYRRWY